MLEADIDENYGKIYDMLRKINRNKKTIRRRRQRQIARDHRKFSLRFDEVKNLETKIRNNKDMLMQIFLHMEEAEELVKLEIKELKKKFKIIRSENPFDFTDYLETQKEESCTDFR